MNTYRIYYKLNGLNRRATKEGKDENEAISQLPEGWTEVSRIEQVDTNSKHIDDELNSIGSKINLY